MKALIVITCCVIIGGVGYYGVKEYRTARHTSECKHLASAARGSAYMAEHSIDSSIWNETLKDTAKEMAALDCRD
jgi:hypothetical protein